MDEEAAVDTAAETAAETAADGAAQTGTILGAGNAAGKADENSGKAGENTQADEQTQAPAVEYDFKDAVPEGMEYDEESAKAFAGVAKEMGFTKEQASKLAGYGMTYAGNMVRAAQQQAEQQRIDTIKSWGESAKQALGSDFQSTVRKAGIGIEALSAKIPGLREAFNETGAGNRVEMIRLMAIVGDLVGEDYGHDGSAGGGEPTIYNNTDFSLYK